MNGEELRERIRRLGLSYRAAARLLGLSFSGLHHNLRDERPVGRQTEIILGYLERDRGSTPTIIKTAVRKSGLRRPPPRSRDAVETFP